VSNVVQIEGGEGELSLPYRNNEWMKLIVDVHLGAAAPIDIHIYRFILERQQKRSRQIFAWNFKINPTQGDHM